MKPTTTFDLSLFRTLNAPTFGTFAVKTRFTFPIGDIFNKTFYKVHDDKIKAFKVLAWALGENHTIHYLIQFPNEVPQWIANFMYNGVFSSVENLINGKSLGSNEIKRYNVFYELPPALEDDSVRFQNSFYINKQDSLVYQTSSVIRYILGTDKGVFIGLQHSSHEHKCSREEVIASTYNNMDVIEFAEPTTIEIKIEVMPQKEFVARKLKLVQ